jgi:hypothetical protein
MVLQFVKFIAFRLKLPSYFNNRLDKKTSNFRTMNFLQPIMRKLFVVAKLV